MATNKKLVHVLKTFNIYVNNGVDCELAFLASLMDEIGTTIADTFLIASNEKKNDILSHTKHTIIIPYK